MEGILEQLNLLGFQMRSERTESWHLAMTPHKRERRKNVSNSDLIYCHVVSLLLELRRVIVPVSHHNPYFMVDNGANLFVNTLDLHHNGLNGHWRL